MTIQDRYAVLRALNKIYRTFRKANGADSDASFAGEHTALAALFDTIGINSGHIVDVAASDGYTQSPTLGFFRRPWWRGLAVEVDPAKFATLAFIYAKFPSVALVRHKVTPNNIASMLSGCEIPNDFALLNLDIDSYDLHVISAMLTAGFRPLVVSMEINEKIPPPIWFSVNYDSAHFWKGDHFYGCSLTAASSVLRPHGYILHSLVYNNALYVRADVIKGQIEGLEDAAAYDLGYRNQDDRKSKFHWNADVERWLHLPVENAVEDIRHHFAKYDGLFTLDAAPREEPR